MPLLYTYCSVEGNPQQMRVVGVGERRCRRFNGLHEGRRKQSGACVKRPGYLLDCEALSHFWNCVGEQSAGGHRSTITVISIDY